VLFLTTNRVGTLDEAVSSRVHTSLFFNYLDRDQTLDLFNMNIKRSQMIARQYADITRKPPLDIKEDEIRGFALRNFDSYKQQLRIWWNGRQIRNAFQIATSLAYEENPTSELKYLGQTHFYRVLDAIEEYAKYRLDVQEKTDDELAYTRKERLNPEQQQRPSDSSRFHHSQMSFPPAPEPGYSHHQQTYMGQSNTMTSMEATASALPHAGVGVGYPNNGGPPIHQRGPPTDPYRQPVQGGTAPESLQSASATYSLGGNMMASFPR
jgi:hypothetical protein